MSLIVSEIYDALIEAGSTEEKAKAAAAAIPVADQMATKEDITDVKREMAGFKVEMAEFKAEIRQDMTDFKAEVRQDMAAFKAEVRQDIADFKAEVRQDIADFKVEVNERFAKIERQIAVLNFAVFSLIPAVMAMLGMMVKLTFFP